MSNQQPPFSLFPRPSTDLPSVNGPVLATAPNTSASAAVHPFSSASSMYSDDENRIYTSDEPLPTASPRSLTAALNPHQPPPLATTFSTRNSIAKLPLDDATEHTQQSIFPQYDSSLPLDQQNYFPTQTSPTRIPRGVISRPLYSPTGPVIPDSPPASIHEPPTMSVDAAVTELPAQPMPRPALPVASSADSAKALFKVANGWAATGSEGRVFTLGLSQTDSSPDFTLSSATAPFYHFKVDPTSASARVTLSRLDPAKDAKGAGPSEGKPWATALATTLEPATRLHRPHDGLVAALMPVAATEMAASKPDDETAQKMAENEYARLVWDDDTNSHYLVHPALAGPFRVSITRHAGWQRTEYTLEHHESPTHLAQLTRDSTTAGTLQVDTALASKINSFFIVDVAVSALLIVAHLDEANIPVAAPEFSPPPVAAPSPAKLRTALRSAESLGSSGSSTRNGDEGLVGSLKRMADRKKKRQVKAMKKNGGMLPLGKPEYENDLESADSIYGVREKPEAPKEEEWGKDLPWPIRAIVWFFTAIFKFWFWILVCIFKFFVLMGKGLGKCVGVQK